MKNTIQKRWDRHYGYATPYWVDLEKPIIVFDSVYNEIVKYEELPASYQKMFDRAIDEFEEGYNNVKRLGCKLYEQFNYRRFSILREIESLGDTIYDMNEV